MPPIHLSLMFTVLCCGPASAAITFSLGNTSVTAGSTAYVSLNASTDQADGETLGGFNLEVDIGDDGTGIPAGFSNFSVDDRSNRFGSESVNEDASDGADRIVNAFNGNVLLEATPQSLLYLTLDVAESITPGIYRISLVNTVLDAAADPDGKELTISSASYQTFGTITVTAVPEPGSMAVLGLGMGGLYVGGRWRRRRKKLAGRS